MADHLLNPPARFSHALTLLVAIAIALAVGTAIGQLPTLVAGFVTLGLFLGALWAYSTGSAPLTIVGTVAVVFGGLALLFTLVVILGVAAGTATSVGGLLLRIVIPVLLLGGVGAVAFDVVPSAVRDQDGPVVVGLLYAGGIATAVFAGVAALQFGVVAVFGTTVTASVDLLRETSLGLLRYSPFTRVGGVVLLLGGALWYGQRVAGLPLVRQLGRRAERLLGVAAAGALAGGRDGAASPVSRDGPSRSAPAWSVPGRSRLAAVNWSRLARVIGTVAFWGGAALVVAGLSGAVQSVGGSEAAAGQLRSTLGQTLALHRLVGRLVLLLVAVRIAHAVGWRLAHLDWATHQRRLAYLNGAVIVLLVGAAIGRPVFETLLATPSLQLLPVGRAGPVITPTDQGVSLALSGTGPLRLEPRPAVFEPVLRNLAAIVGVPVLGIGLLAGLLDVSFLLLLVVGLGAASSGLSRPAAGLGQLFTAVVGASILGVAPWLAFGGAAAALVAADTRSLGEGLGEQLDAAAPTLRGEIVHVSANALIVAVVVVAMRAAIELVRVIPVPDEPWQLFGALWLTLLAALLSVLVLGVRDG